MNRGCTNIARIRTAMAVCAVLLWIVLSRGAFAQDTAAPLLYGYSTAHSLEERQLEQRFDGALDPQDLRSWLQLMSAAPNHVGSPHDQANAEWTLERLREWGWDAQIERFEVLYPTPRKALVELLSPRHFRARLHEPAVAGDRSSANSAGALPPYAIYGADGDVSAELVYVNFGMREDYEELERRGISVKGRIVIARYGGGWRGLKPKLAYEHGAIGCLIYSDPHEDGYAVGDTYPQGGWRPADGVQRGSVADITQYTGDPLTPGIGATAEAQRLPLSEAKTLAKIPVQPMAYADAQPLLAAIGGPVAPPTWRGSLGITYHIGPGPARVHLQVESDWSRRTLYDVIARITGSELPDEWVVRGNHRDGWVFGAWDPLSGNVALLSEAQAIGRLVKGGWRPRRTLIYCSWDGEEPGLLGSTEWAETHAQALKSHAVLYVNSDENARGFLNMGGSPSWQHALNEVAAEVTDPQTGVSVLSRERAKLRVDAYGATSESVRQLASAAASGGDLPLRALGSGSDYTPFLQHLGVASIDLGFSGEADNAGVYHSQYDTFEHYLRFGDPTFAYGIALAQTAGHLMLRAANADVLPMRLGEVAQGVEGYLREVHALLDERREHARKLDELRQARAFELAADPTRALAAPRVEAQVPFLDFAPLDNAVAHLQRVTHSYDEAYALASTRGFALEGTRRLQLDTQLQALEQQLTSERGLPGRPWYTHLVYAPGVYTGYSAQTLPGVREAIEDQRWEDANRYVQLTAQAIEAYCAAVETAIGTLGD